VLFDFETDVQSSYRYQQFGFGMLMACLILPSFAAIYFDPVLAFTNFCCMIPLVIVLVSLFSWISGRADNGMVNKFCDDNPSSFVCDLI
jgi:hypothetical protein